MDIKVAAMCGAAHGERSPDRETQLNGYLPRQWKTRAAPVAPNTPKLRKTRYFSYRRVYLTSKVIKKSKMVWASMDAFALVLVKDDDAALHRLRPLSTAASLFDLQR